ncbi:hypothetical protein JCM3770_007237, partial [Rhodotorula araucariae]
DTEATALAAALQQALLPAVLAEQLPKSQIDLFVTVLESDGWDGDVSIGTTAASVALAEAGIPLRGLVTSCSAALLPSPSSRPLAPSASDPPPPSPPAATALLDPTRAEARSAHAFVTLACVPALGTTTSVRVSGVVDPAALAETLASMYGVCGLLHGVAKDALLAARRVGDSTGAGAGTGLQ